MPAMLWHEGIWTGSYRHLGEDSSVLDQHQSRVVCEFPTEGEAAYRQTSSFNWSDGRSQEQTFLGYMRGERMWFDTATFAGWAWQTGDDIIMLSLDRKDLPGQRFVETILIGEERNRRVRTWHWFDQGVCYKRTLCTETREA